MFKQRNHRILAWPSPISAACTGIGKSKKRMSTVKFLSPQQSIIRHKHGSEPSLWESWRQGGTVGKKKEKMGREGKQWGSKTLVGVERGETVYTAYHNKGKDCCCEDCKEVRVNGLIKRISWFVLFIYLFGIYGLCCSISVCAVSLQRCLPQRGLFIV